MKRKYNNDIMKSNAENDAQTKNIMKAIVN